ncbi:MAG: 23S rRNA (pseudouridine(1915)-N(3))-methyltransferase RlmH [Chthoniobacteraceae bacterium]|nr:23S rRNA (pseudouridine(1915)-N(3))-methyltransferase RlmH [Chthoniobacteraceae bacterium]
MHWNLFVIGKPKLAFARAGVEEYAKRLRPFAPVTLECLKASSREAESALLLQRSRGMLRIVLDERGEEPSSRALADRVTGWEREGVKAAAILIGGADGHTEALRAEAGWIWSLSRLTLQHELALVVLYEQIYRAYSLKAGLPYHRD